MSDSILIKGARLHNLQNVSLAIPKNKLVVFSGLSGSGKSTLAVDTLHREAQRQVLESLGLVTFALSRPPIDSIEGLSPSIGIDPLQANRSPRSTVGTATEVFTYLRVLFARLGRRPCPRCGGEVPPAHDLPGVEPWEEGPEAGGADPAAEAEEAIPCPHCGAPLPALTMAHFSFNKPAGACPTCTGLGVVHQVKLEAAVDPARSILDGAIRDWDPFSILRYSEVLRAAGKHYGLSFDPARPVGELEPAQWDLLIYGVDSAQFRRHVPGIKPPDAVGRGAFEGVVPGLLRRYGGHAGDPAYRDKFDRVLRQEACPECGGTRLRAESRRVTVAGRTIVDLARLPLGELAAWLDGLREAVAAGEPAADPAGTEEWALAEPVVADLAGRLRRLLDVGVGYLTLDRASPTLSAGEAQRLRLASLLGSALTGMLYVLDEPTVGLHPRDTARLIEVLVRLRDLGNTVLVIEHDLELLAAADHVVDLGPGAGREGGRIVVAGSPAAVAACPESVTGGHLSGRLTVPAPAARRQGSGPCLWIRGAREHNLKNLTVRLPLARLIAVTGVSGSGKSTLLFDILDRAARQHFSGAADPPGDHDAIEGWEQLARVIAIDQSAIGRSPRSNAATYSEAFGPIRAAFAATPEARQRGLTARHFSFNVPGGRCERCEGAGVLQVEMHFLPSVPVRCPACRGLRFKRELLAVTYRGHSIAAALSLPIAEAAELFRDVPQAAARLGVMVEAGLGYLQLGQPAPSLSGGEAQRVKLARELGRRPGGGAGTLYLLDEPTTGLHPADVARLLAVLQRLVDAGHTVVVVEHNLDLIRAADWVIDLGPEGGEAGGYLVAEGTPEEVARVQASATGAYLRR